MFKVAKLLPMFDDFGTGAKLSCTAVETAGTLDEDKNECDMKNCADQGG